MLKFRLPGENCLIFNWHSSGAAPGISFFAVTTKDNEYCTNWRNNTAAVITRDTVPVHYAALFINRSVNDNYMTLLMALHHTLD